nr:response regulator [uncultured Roseateles sp.]
MQAPETTDLEPAAHKLPTLRLRLATQILGLLFVAVASFGLLFYFLQARPLLINLAAADAERASSQVEARINEATASLNKLADIAGGWGRSGLLDIDKPMAFNQILKQLLLEHPLVDTVHLADAQGRELSLHQLEEDRGWLNRVVLAAGEHKHRWLTHDTGLKRSEERIDAQVYQPQEQPWFKAALGAPEDNHLVWTAPYLNGVSGETVVSAAMRWHDPKGQLLILAFDLSLQDFSDFTSKLSIGKSGRAAVLMADGRLIGVPLHPSTATRDAVKKLVLVPIDQTPFDVLRAAYTTWQQGGMKDIGLLRFAVPAENNAVWFARVQRPSKPGMFDYIVMTVVPESDFVSIDGAFVAQALLMLAVLSVLGYLMARRMATKLSRSMAALAKESRRIGRMDLNEPVRIDARFAELQSLVDAQEAMRQRLLQSTTELAEMNHSLEAKVAQRTAQLAENEARLLAILQDSPIGVGIVGKDGVVHFCNRQLARLLGLSEDEVKQHNFAEFWTEPGAREHFLSTLSTGVDVLDQEVQFQRPDGQPFWVLLNSLNLDYQDQPCHISWFYDSTERHAAMLALKQAHDLAEEAAKMKADFLANMSHEIRTPMNAIIGMSHLAMKTGLNPRQMDYVSKIQQAGRHLLGIINDILDFSKIEAGKLSLEELDFELDKVLDNLANLVGEKASNKGLELLFDVAKDVPAMLRGDPLRLGQVLVNFANNAIKFTEVGEVSIVVRVEQDLGDRLRLRFTVKDTGIGLDEAQQALLFQAFQQADSSTTRKYGGTGLGLAICKQIAELMGGQTGVISQLGQGSSFWFTAEFKKSEALPPSYMPQPDLRDRRVLVVDDNAHARTVLNDLLESMTFRVAQAASGPEALEEIDKARAGGEPFELVLLDWQMPGMDGIEAARRIQVEQKDAAPKLVMVTAYGREEVVSQARATGIEDVLIKPVSASMLFDTAIRLLSDAAPAAGKADAASPDALLDQLASRRGARILVVEDNELNQQVISDLLTDAGFVVEVAEHGGIALDMLANKPYALVLMDMQMPVMDGLTATRLLRERPALADLPVLAMTANAMQADRDRCLQAGMNDHLSKPIEPDALWKALLHWIPAQTAGAQDQAGAAPSAAAAQALPGSATGPAPIALPEIAGLDVQSGLRRVLGKPERYLATLRRYQSNQAAATAQIRAALLQDDYPTAERLAHTSKGLAGNIGADAVQASAAALEQALAKREAQAVWSPLLDHFDAALAGLLAALQASLAEESAAASPAADIQWGTDESQQLIQRLAQLLADDDAEAGQLFAEQKASLQALLGQRFRELEAAFGGYDFEEALLTLKAAAAQAAHPLD